MEAAAWGALAASPPALQGAELEGALEMAEGACNTQCFSQLCEQAA
jgi:hypothetical protein